MDKIFYRSGGGVYLAPTDYHVADEVFVDADGAPLSDHFAVSVVFAFEGVPEPAPELLLAGLGVAAGLLRRRRAPPPGAALGPRPAGAGQTES